MPRPTGCCPWGKCPALAPLSPPPGGESQTPLVAPNQLGRGHWLVPEATMCSTATLAAPRHLGFSDVSHDSARVFWEGSPRPVRLFRVSFVSSEGSHSGQVRVPGATGGPGVQRGRGEQRGPAPPAPTPCVHSCWVLAEPPAPASACCGADSIPAFGGPSLQGQGRDRCEARNQTNTHK